MEMIKKLAQFFIILATSTSIAYAYLDPVSASFILQGVIGAIAAVLASIRSVREKFLNRFFSLLGLKNKKEKSDDEPI